MKHKPCPFCGSAVEMAYADQQSSYWWRINCPMCGSLGRLCSADKREKHWLWWDTRAPIRPRKAPKLPRYEFRLYPKHGDETAVIRLMSCQIELEHIAPTKRQLLEAARRARLPVGDYFLYGEDGAGNRYYLYNFFERTPWYSP